VSHAPEAALLRQTGTLRCLVCWWLFSARQTGRASEGGERGGRHRERRKKAPSRRRKAARPLQRRNPTCSPPHRPPHPHREAAAAMASSSVGFGLRGTQLTLLRRAARSGIPTASYAHRRRHRHPRRCLSLSLFFFTTIYAGRVGARD